MSMNLVDAKTDHPIKRSPEIKGRFELHRLTREEREALGVAEYCRPFRVEHGAMLKDRSKFWMCKRTFDVICSSIALIVLLPVILVMMLLIYIEDPHSSPLFKQGRVGRGGKIFKLYNLRWMQVVHELHKIQATIRVAVCRGCTRFPLHSDFRHSIAGFAGVFAA